MQIKCSSCDRSINVPDKKLPKNKVVTITCPGCKSKIKIDQHLQSSATAPPQVEDQEPQKDIDMSVLVESPEFEDDEDQEFYDENDKIALILDDQNKEAWTRELEALDYKIQYAGSPEHAAHKMKFTQFHFIALHENFGNVSLEDNVAYQSLLEMQMTTRRKIFLGLVGEQFKSANNMQAFAASANLVINQKEIGKLSQFLKRSIAENEIFYKIFKETLTSLGKL